MLLASIPGGRITEGVYWGFVMKRITDLRQYFSGERKGFELHQDKTFGPSIIRVLF